MRAADAHCFGQSRQIGPGRAQDSRSFTAGVADEYLAVETELRQIFAQHDFERDRNMPVFALASAGDLK